MGRRKNEKLEFRFYEVPVGSSALALLGDDWVGTYGQRDECLHFHNLFEIGYCHFGRGKLLLGERELNYEDAMISAIPVNYPHMTVSDGVSSWEFLFFEPAELLREMYPGDPKKQAERSSTVSKCASLLRIEENPELAATVWQILEEARLKRPYCQDVIRNLLKVFLLELIRLNDGLSAELPWTDKSDNILAQITPALLLIDEHFDQNFRAADLARECGLSEPQFRRIFSECVNMPPMDYLNLIRVRRACALLSRKDVPMEIAAAECGFSSVSAFSRNFKKFLNVTPYQWKLHRRENGTLEVGYTISPLRGWSSL